MNLRIALSLLFLIVFNASCPGQSLTTMVQTGPSSNRIDVVTVGDGYQSSEIGTYTVHVQDYLDHMFQQQPFQRYEKFFNVHRVDVISNESGADDPTAGTTVDTALNSTYLYDGQTQRLLYLNNGLANNAMNTALAGSGIDVDMKVASVNSTQYGGGGGQWAVYAGGNGSAPELALHEIGHSFSNLADEYEGVTTPYTGSEPSEVNVTANSASGKWDRWLGYIDPSTGEVGYYEGGRYYSEGIFRPSTNSKMRSLNRDFDPVSREQFISKFYDHVDPLDGWDANSSTLVDPATVSVMTIDPNVIDVEWVLNGSSIGVLGESLNVNSLISGGTLGVGTHTLVANAYDSILQDSFTGSGFDWWRYTDTSKLRQSVTWTVEVTAVPEPSQVLMLCLLGCFVSTVRFIRRR